tara:strand:+ start:831 stop:1289 length:459 start_codon:yes stop_codon:yes gene_type:complete
MFKKILACLVSILVVMAPISASAEEMEGKVTSLSLNQKAPYAGVLLDPIAASKMVVNQKYLKSEIELRLRKEFQQDLASKRLAFDLLKVEHDSLQKIHKETTLLRDQQINDLNVLLKEEMGNDYTEWWVMGGVVIGIVLSVAVFYASVEVAR